MTISIRMKTLLCILMLGGDWCFARLRSATRGQTKRWGWTSPTRVRRFCVWTPKGRFRKFADSRFRRMERRYIPPAMTKPSTCGTGTSKPIPSSTTATDRCESRLVPASTGAINTLAVSSDGRYIAVAGSAMGEHLSDFSSEGLILPRSAQTVEQHQSVGTIYVFDQGAAQQPGQAPTLIELKGHVGPVILLGFAPAVDGKPPRVGLSGRRLRSRHHQVSRRCGCGTSSSRKTCRGKISICQTSRQMTTPKKFATCPAPWRWCVPDGKQGNRYSCRHCLGRLHVRSGMLPKAMSR